MGTEAPHRLLENGPARLWTEVRVTEQGAGVGPGQRAWGRGRPATGPEGDSSQSAGTVLRGTLTANPLAQQTVPDAQSSFQSGVGSPGGAGVQPGLNKGRASRHSRPCQGEAAMTEEAPTWALLTQRGWGSCCRWEREMGFGRGSPGQQRPPGSS